MEAHSLTIFAGSSSVFASLFLGIFALKRKVKVHSALPFSLLMFFNALYATAYTLEINSGSLGSTIEWLKVEYIGVMMVPVAWFAFSRSFAEGTRPMKASSFAALSILPAITVLLMWTNESHSLIYTSLSLREGTSLSILSASRGPWYWVCTAYLYVLLAMGTLSIALRISRIEGKFRGQTLCVLAAVVLPWVGHGLLLARLSPHGLDLTPFLVSISGLLFFVGIFRFNLFDLVPVAREMVVDAIRDGVIVVDPARRIVDANVAARAAIPALRDVAMGSSADPVLGALGIPALGVAEVTFESGAGTRRYSATAFEIEERGRPRGTVVILSDITETHELMAKLERLATTDELTQVDNRRSFFERAERELDIARRKGRAIAFAMLDLDGFKRVNDLRGHAAGDD